MRFSRVSWRGVRVLAPLGTIAIAFAISCVDTPTPPKSSDDWAGDAVVSLQMRSDFQFIADGKPLAPHLLGEAESKGLVFPGTGVVPRAASARAGKSNALLRHLTDRTGRVRSLGIVLDESGRPPKRLYLFEDGRIQAVYSPRYSRHGNGWIRIGARLVLFGPEGSPVAAVNIGRAEHQSGVTPTGRTRAVAADVLTHLGHYLLPKPAYAEEIGPDCWKEFLSTVGAEISTIGSGLLTVVTALGCKATAGTFTPACVAALGALGFTATQIEVLATNFDKLINCELRSWMNFTNSTGGGSSLEPKTRPMAPIDNTGVFMTVEEFIENAESSCSADGNYCIYYAE